MTGVAAVAPVRLQHPGTFRRRRTKIVATIGPASDSPEILRAMVDAGMDMARIGLAHGPVEQAAERIARVRAAAAGAEREVGILADLPGPKVRAASFPPGGVSIAEGDTIELVPGGGDGAVSDGRRIVVEHDRLLEELLPGDLIALGDGNIQLVVVAVESDRARATVRSGGRLEGRPGVNLPPERFTAATPTADDLRLLGVMMTVGVDAVAISFVRTADDVQAVRTAMGRGPMVIAKIETPTAVADIERIIECADGVMIARGDLGVRCPLEDVPHLQKRIIAATVAYGRPVITATQMLESMVHSPTPTRAEVSDVANAVFDGTSALMLSGETAIGRDPVGVIRTMSRIAERAEEEFDYSGWGARLGVQAAATRVDAPPAVRITAATTAAGWRAAIDCNAAAIICCTTTGYTARAIARFRPTAPLLAFTPYVEVARQLSVAWGVKAFATERRSSPEDMVWFAVQSAVETGVVVKGDIVVVLVGSPDDPEPTTDVLRLIRIR
jgi:pyruvate kinase